MPARRDAQEHAGPSRIQRQRLRAKCRMQDNRSCHDPSRRYSVVLGIIPGNRQALFGVVTDLAMSLSAIQSHRPAPPRTPGPSLYTPGPRAGRRRLRRPERASIRPRASRASRRTESSRPRRNRLACGLRCRPASKGCQEDQAVSVRRCGGEANAARAPYTCPMSSHEDSTELLEAFCLDGCCEAERGKTWPMTRWFSAPSKQNV
jgi:hypothetical protein